MGAKPDLPPAQRDLTKAARLSPAEQDLRRGEVERSGTAFYQDTIKLPGFGYKPERCKPYSPVGFCVDHGHVVLGQSACGNRGCPDHWKEWLEDGVVSDVARLAAYRHVQEGWGKRLLHIVLSPEQDRRWTAEQVWETRSEAYEVAEAVGVRGGRTYTHPYRTSDRADALFETAVERGDWEKSDGKWKLARDLADDWEEMGAYTEAAPHYHALVACEDFEPEAAPEGWVAKNIRSLPRFDYRDVEAYRPMARVAWYLRTHSGVQQSKKDGSGGKHSVTWFGEMHPAAFDPEEELSEGVWGKIQEMAEKAISTKPGGVPVEEGVESMECPHEDCESPVEPILRLSQYMDDEEWWEAIMPKQRARLRGVRLWLTDQDRPPPGRLGSEEALLTWLEHKGGTMARRAPGTAKTEATSLLN